MSKKLLFVLWGGLYAICAVFGFFPDSSGALRVLRILLALSFFIPPLLLIHTGDRAVLRLVRNLAAIWLVLTTVLIIANFLTVGASLRLGNMLFVLLAIISSPMICGQIWVISLFGWSYLLFACINALRKR